MYSIRMMLEEVIVDDSVQRLQRAADKSTRLNLRAYISRVLERDRISLEVSDDLLFRCPEHTFNESGVPSFGPATPPDMYTELTTELEESRRMKLRSVVKH